MKFINPHLLDEKRTLLSVFLWKMGYFDDPREEKKCPPTFSQLSSLFPLEKEEKGNSSAIWINHSTFFLKINGLRFLTDPIWSRRCSPISFLGPIRRHDPPLSLEELGHVDHVLISHNHYDHLDRDTVLSLFRLYPNIQWWVPKGVKKWFSSLGIHRVNELHWWDCQEVLQDLLRVTAVPAQHFSGRSFWDFNRTLWVGWVVESLQPSQEKRFYFAGDTGYNPIDFQNIGKKWPFMDLSLLPIGAYIPKKFMSPVHISPDEAVRIHEEVQSKKSLGIHWNTFHLSDEEELRPAYDLWLALQHKQISPQQFLAVPPGVEIFW